MAQRKRNSSKEEDYEQEVEWLVEETAKLKVDLASLVLSIPRAIIALARSDKTPEPAPEPPEEVRRGPAQRTRKP